MIICFCAYMACASSAFAATTDNQVSQNGLAGWWTLNEATGTVAHDSSGNRHNGTLVSSPSSVFGKIGQALNFNGSTQWVDTNWTTDIYSNAKFTVSVWVKTTNTGTIQVASKGGCSAGGCQAGWEIQTTGASGWQFLGKPSSMTCQTAKLVDDGNWHLLTAVASTSTTVANSTCTIYTDGVLSNNTVGGTFTSDTADTLQIGHRNQPTFFTGSIDDFRVYSRALSATEITNLYKQGTAFTNAPGTSLQNGSSLSSGLVGYWTFDGKDTPWTSATAATAIDKSGNGNTGTLTNMSQSTSPVPGKIGQALKFNGSNSYVRTATFSNPPSSNMTICSWVNTSATGDQYIMNINRNPSNVTNEGIYVITGNKQLFWDYNGSSFGFTNASGSSNTSVNDGKWHDVCFTKSGTAGTYYLDGAADGTKTASLNITYGTADWIAGYNYRDSNSDLNGSLDDVRIYNRALSASEVKQLYNLSAGTHVNAPATSLQNGSSLGSGLAGYWTFDGKETPWTSATAATAIDKSGNGNTGTLTNMSQTTSPTQGKIGQALSFNGTSQYVVVNSSLTYSSATISEWFKTKSTANSVAFSLQNSANNANVDLAVNNGSVGADCWNGSSAPSFFTASIYNDGKWHNAVITFVGNTNESLYVDGRFAGSSTPNVSVAGGTYIGIARNQHDGNNYFQGSIDDVRIYNRTLSAAEIAGLYNLGH